MIRKTFGCGMMVPDTIVAVFYKLLISWNFHVYKICRIYKSWKNNKDPVFWGQNTFYMGEVTGERAGFCKLTESLQNVL